MVPKLHAKGASFKGAAAYLLHDKGRAVTSERVEWVETRNLATSDRHVAWKVMAATAMDAGRLKQQVGVKNTGRKSTDSVLHFSLSWHPDEHTGLSRAEMRRAAFGAIRALGADDRQAMLICHNDEKQPHVHVVVNRISPQDGRMLSSSKERLNLSKWAQSYEQERGKVLCAQRAINNAARNRDEFTRGKKDRARNVYELEAVHGKNEQAKAIAEEQRRAAAVVAKAQRETKARHQEERAALDAKHKQRQTETKARLIERQAEAKETAKKRLAAAVAQVRKDYRPSWERLFSEKQTERREFDQREEKLVGRVHNALRAIDFGAIMQGHDRRKAISEAFQSFSDAGKRLEGLQKAQERRATDLHRQQRQAEREAATPIRADYKDTLQKNREQLAQDHQKNREQFAQERKDLAFTHAMETAKIRAEWKTQQENRDNAWEQVAASQRKAAADNIARVQEAKQRLEAVQQRTAGRDISHDRERGE
jgi:Relaxase/Mobilisation nuclease domain